MIGAAAGEAVRYVLIAALAATAAVRLLRRRGRGSGGPGWRARLPLGRGLGPDRVSAPVTLVAGREIRERVRSRVFTVGTVIILLAVVAGVVIPVVRRGHAGVERVGVVGVVSAPVRAGIVATGPRVGTTVALVDEPSLDAADRDVRGGRLAMALVGTDRLVVKQAFGPSDTTTTAVLARAVAATVGLQAGLEAAGLPPARAAAVAHSPPVPVAALQPASASSTSRVAALYGVLLTFVMLAQYGTWILMGVVEEKASRVVEVLLATLRPVQLLTGKVVGIGAVAIGQAALIVVVALGLGAVLGSDLLKGSGPAGVAAALMWVVLGYAFYCWVYAAAGSLVERQDQVQAIAFPLQVPILIGYVLAFTALGSGNPSLLVRVLAFLPPTAPFEMPVLVALGRVAWWEVALSAALTVLATVAVARVAAAVYAGAILRTGRRVPLRVALSRDAR